MLVRQVVKNNPGLYMSLKATHQPGEICVSVYQNPELRMSCNCNVHIYYNICFTPTSTTQCCDGRQYGQSYPDFKIVSSQI